MTKPRVFKGIVFWFVECRKCDYKKLVSRFHAQAFEFAENHAFEHDYSRRRA